MTLSVDVPPLPPDATMQYPVAELPSYPVGQTWQTELKKNRPEAHALQLLVVPAHEEQVLSQSLHDVPTCKVFDGQVLTHPFL